MSRARLVRLLHDAHGISRGRVRRQRADRFHAAPDALRSLVMGTLYSSPSPFRRDLSNPPSDHIMSRRPSGCGVKEPLPFSPKYCCLR